MGWSRNIIFVDVCVCSVDGGEAIFLQIQTRFKKIGKNCLKCLGTLLKQNQRLDWRLYFSGLKVRAIPQFALLVIVGFNFDSKLTFELHNALGKTGACQNACVELLRLQPQKLEELPKMLGSLKRLLLLLSKIVAVAWVTPLRIFWFSTPLCGYEKICRSDHSAYCLVELRNFTKHRIVLYIKTQ